MLCIYMYMYWVYLCTETIICLSFSISNLPLKQGTLMQGKKPFCIVRRLLVLEESVICSWMAPWDPTPFYSSLPFHFPPYCLPLELQIVSLLAQRCVFCFYVHRASCALRVLWKQPTANVRYSFSIQLIHHEWQLVIPLLRTTITMIVFF